MVTGTVSRKCVKSVYLGQFTFNFAPLLTNISKLIQCICFVDTPFAAFNAEKGFESSKNLSV